MSERVTTGLERLTTAPPGWMRQANLGLLANQASVGPGFVHAANLIDKALPGRLKMLVGPQHGFAGEKQDNMVESGHGVDAATGRPIYSLYGQSRRPTPEMLSGLDALLIDLTDVGTRVYTFVWTMAYCLEAAARSGIKVVILDRPNPIGGTEIEGNMLRPDCASFVGLHPLPMRHGLTIGELALYIADRLPERPELVIVEMTGWHREMYFPDTGLPWVLPSPNMPTPETAWVYPGQVLWEGTNISEGRGTTRPFCLFGAPFIDPERLKTELENRGIGGAYFRPAAFEPTFHKFQGRICRGLEIHPFDKIEFKPYRTSLTILEFILKLWPDEFAWKEPPYEYEFERMPIDLILGDKAVRTGLEAGKTVPELEKNWSAGLEEFRRERERYLLYPDSGRSIAGEERRT